MVNIEKVVEIKNKVDELKLKKQEYEEKLTADLNILQSECSIVPIISGFRFDDDQFGRYIEFIVILQYDSEDDASYYEYFATKFNVGDYSYVLNKYTDNTVTNNYTTDIVYRYYI